MVVKNASDDFLTVRVPLYAMEAAARATGVDEWVARALVVVAPLPAHHWVTWSARDGQPFMGGLN